MAENLPVSVVIPVFNRAKLIADTLDSVLAQTHRPLEIVVVDDGSTDGTAEAVAGWSARNEFQQVTVHCVSQSNEGANAARNRGIEESRHEVIAFLDSDDRWLPGKLQSQLAALAARDLIGGVYCGLRTVGLDSGEVAPPLVRDYPTGNLLARMLIQDVSNPTSCWMVRKRCFEEVGYFDTSLPARQDWDMWIRLSAKFEIACVPEVLVEMGEHAGERVRSDPAREIRAHQAIFKKYENLRRQFPFWISLAARSAMYRRRGRVYLHREDARLRAAGYELLAIACWPVAFDSYAALLGTVLPAGLRSRVHVIWNRLFGKTGLAIKSH